MNSLEMEAFTAVITYGNFSEAASRLFLSQSTLSTRIQALELELGAKLFVRGKGLKRVELTESGKQLAFAGKSWQLFMADIEKIKSVNRGECLQLSFGSVDTYNSHLFTPLFQELRQQGEQLDIKIRTYNSTELYQEIDSGHLDVAFTLLSIPMEGIEIQEAFREPRVILLNGALPKGQSAGSALQQLDWAKEIFFIGDAAFNEWHRSIQGDRQQRLLEVDTDRLLLPLLSEPGAWSIVPLCVGRELAANDHFTIYELAEQAPERVCYRIQRASLTRAERRALAIFDSCLQSVRHKLWGCQ